MYPVTPIGIATPRVLHFMRRISALLAAFLAVLASAEAAYAIDATALQTKLTREIGLAGGYSGAYARDLATGRELVAVRQDAARIPASVEKVFVAAAALLRFGPSRTLDTRSVAAAAPDAEGVVAGDVWLVGSGDPTLTDDRLRALARAVRDAGVDRIEGRVAADDTVFDGKRGGPRTGGRPDYDIGGRLGALVLRRGFQPDPALYAAARFARHLRATGITVPVRPKRGNAPAAEDGAVDLGAVPSPPLADLVRLQNVPSDNFIAEMLIKVLGAGFGGAGTTGTGAQVIRDTLDDFGVRPRIVDGSGLSRANRTTPRQVVRLFERMEGQPVSATFLRSLARPGISGTVRRRMRGTAATGCRVKTGTLRGVSNLVGVCGRVAFAWLMNGVNVYSAHRIQDRMTVAVARYSASG